jgi:hypothetical protein
VKKKRRKLQTVLPQQSRTAESTHLDSKMTNFAKTQMRYPRLERQTQTCCCPKETDSCQRKNPRQKEKPVLFVQILNVFLFFCFTSRCNTTTICFVSQLANKCNSTTICLVSQRKQMQLDHNLFCFTTQTNAIQPQFVLFHNSQTNAIQITSTTMKP